MFTRTLSEGLTEVNISRRLGHKLSGLALCASES